MRGRSAETTIGLALIIVLFVFYWNVIHFAIRSMARSSGSPWAQPKRFGANSEPQWVYNTCLISSGIASVVTLVAIGSVLG